MAGNHIHVIAELKSSLPKQLIPADIQLSRDQERTGASRLRFLALW